jgi:hypothetical protein
MKKRICGYRHFFRQLDLFEGAQRAAPPQPWRGGQVREALPPSTNRGGKSPRQENVRFYPKRNGVGSWVRLEVDL